MSAYGAGKIATGVMQIVGVVLLVASGLIGLTSLVAQQFGPVANAVAAAVVVYIVSTLLTRRLIGPMRLGTISGAALGGYLGSLAWASNHGFSGTVGRGLVTAVLCGIFMTIGFLLRLYRQSSREKELIASHLAAQSAREGASARQRTVAAI